MLFNSLEFLVFFPVAVVVYFLTPARHRWAWLLGASYYFYASWRAEYLLLIVGSTLVDYFAGRRMGRLETKRERRPYLILSLCTNLGILFTFKYLGFFSASLNAIFTEVHLINEVPVLDFLLPVGISFYTFQTLSYTIDMYQGNREPERHLGIFALYVSFFPQLVAGPIERSRRLLPQFHQKHDFDWPRISSGLKLMIWGFFKKLVIADRLQIYVYSVYNAPGEYSGVPVILATYFFAFQIYCDFSGYSDIAIGAARVMGFDLMENFRRPYFSKSIVEFWRRWHISLSTWFRDYLYIPLGGNRVTKWRWYYNLMVVFVLSGLWHGAAWTFVVWGALHGAFLVASIMTQDLRDRLWKGLERLSTVAAETRHRTAGWLAGVSLHKVRRYLAILTTFHLVLVGWVFFRARNIEEAWTLIESMFVFDGEASLMPHLQNFSVFALCVAAFGLAVLFVVHLIERRQSLEDYLADRPTWVRWAVYQGLVVSIFLFGTFREVDFIYFQF